MFRAICGVLLLIFVPLGCGHSVVDSPEKIQDIAVRLRITTWNIGSFAGKTVRIEARGENDGAIEFLVTPDTVLATQVASVHHAITVFVLDDTGVVSSYIPVGSRIDGLRPSCVAKGVLYEYNRDPMVTITEVKNSSIHGVDTKGSIRRF